MLDVEVAMKQLLSSAMLNPSLLAIIVKIFWQNPLEENAN